MACYTQKVHIQSHRNADKWQQTSKLRREREKKPAQAKSLIELILNKVAAEKQIEENKREENRREKKGSHKEIMNKVAETSFPLLELNSITLNC